MGRSIGKWLFVVAVTAIACLILASMGNSKGERWSYDTHIETRFVDGEKLLCVVASQYDSVSVSCVHSAYTNR